MALEGVQPQHSFAVRLLDAVILAHLMPWRLKFSAVLHLVLCYLKLIPVCANSGEKTRQPAQACPLQFCCEREHVIYPLGEISIRKLAIR